MGLTDEKRTLRFSVAQHIEAEHAVLGSMLIDSECVGVVMAEANEEDFSEELRPVFIAFRELYFAKAVLDPVTVLDRLKKDIGFALLDYQQLLLNLMQVTPTAANVRVYLKLLREQSAVRKASNIGFALMEAHSLEEARDMVDELNKIICERQNVRIVSFSQGLAEFYKRHDVLKAPEYLRWGFGPLNKMLCAEAGDFIILGGYPSAGKTVAAIEFAWEIASYGGKRVGIFSLETKDEKLYDRLICRVAGVPFDEIKHNTISSESWSAIAGITHFTDTVHLDVIRAAGLTANDIRAVTLSQHYDVIFIDYLQLIQTGGRYKGNRTEEVAGISMALHTFAQTSDVTVVALSQLRRAEAGEKNKAPTMASLRESGQLEQDADIVMLLYLIDEKNPNGPRRLKVAKNKEGERGYIDLGFDPEKMSFAQLSSRSDEPKQRSRFTEAPPSHYQDELPGFLKEGKS